MSETKCVETNPVERLVSYFIYSFGEADGPFTCEHRNSKNECDCHESTWLIFTETRVEPRKALMTGQALCSGHVPVLYEAGSSCMATLARMGS